MAIRNSISLSGFVSGPSDLIHRPISGSSFEGGSMLNMNAGDPQLRDLDHASPSTVHALQGKTVDTVIATIEASAERPCMAATRKSTRGLRLSVVGPAGDSRLPGRMRGSWVCGYGGYLRQLSVIRNAESQYDRFVRCLH